MFDLALKVFLFLSPIFILPFNGWAQRYQWYQFGYFTSSIDLLQLQFFQYGIVALFLVALFEKPKRLSQDKCLGLLLGICILGVIWHPKTIQNFYNIFLGFLLYYLVITYTKNVKSVLKIVVVVSVLNTVFALLQFFNINLIYQPKYISSHKFGGQEIIGLMGYKTHLGIYQAIALPICYLFNPFLSIIPLIGLVLSKSITALICGLLGMAWLFKDKLSKVFNLGVVFLMLFMSIGVLLYIKFFSNFSHKLDLRFEVWGYTLQAIANKWFYGYGAGVFKHVGKLTTYQNPYSLYLQIAYAFGISGLIIFGAFIYKKLRGDIKDKYLHCSCLILVLSGLGYCFLDYPRLAGTVIVLFGLLAITKGGNLENSL